MVLVSQTSSSPNHSIVCMSAEKKTAIGVVQGNLDEAKELVSSCVEVSESELTNGCV